MARFYHYSHHDAKVLTPQLGDARHAAEDPRAVNKPVVWLHSMELNDTHNQRGTYEFLHIVEIDESDCQLFMDEPFDSLMKIVEKDIGVSSRPWRWYFYTGPIPIVETRKWNGTEYV